MVGWLVEVCRRGLKVKGGRSKVMVLNGEEGLECEVHLEHVSEFKYLGFVLDKSGTNGENIVGRRLPALISQLSEHNTNSKLTLPSLLLSYSLLTGNRKLPPYDPCGS